MDEIAIEKPREQAKPLGGDAPVPQQPPAPEARTSAMALDELAQPPGSVSIAAGDAGPDAAALAEAELAPAPVPPVVLEPAAPAAATPETPQVLPPVAAEFVDQEPQAIGRRGRTGRLGRRAG